MGYSKSCVHVQSAKFSPMCVSVVAVGVTIISFILHCFFAPDIFLNSSYSNDWRLLFKMNFPALSTVE